MPEYDKIAIAKLRFENAERCLTSANIMLENGDYKATIMYQKQGISFSQTC